ncbi:MAG: extensin family protein [Hyphomicrobiaceae bacterium]
MTRSETSNPRWCRRPVNRRTRRHGAALAIVLALSGTIASAVVAQSRVVPLPVPAPKAPSAAGASSGLDKSKASPTPDIWSESEIADAKRICQEALKSMSAVLEPLPPVKNGRCGAPAPVRLVSIGQKHPVKFLPAPTVSCRMLKPLKRWIDTALQPAAAKRLEARVASVSIMSSYSCRTRYGRKGARMSEHAFANALDIGGFRLSDGRRVSVLEHWGLTRRDIAKAAALAKQRQAAEIAAAGSAHAAAPSQQPAGATKSPLPAVRIKPKKDSATRPGPRRLQSTRQHRNVERPVKDVTLPTLRQRTGQTPSLQRITPPLPTRRPLRRAVRWRASLHKPRTKRDPGFKQPPFRLGGPKPPASKPLALFLRGIHRTACRIFGTTLGPEANEAHRNHFHFDMFPRRRRKYCE